MISQKPPNHAVTNIWEPGYGKYLQRLCTYFQKYEMFELIFKFEGIYDITLK